METRANHIWVGAVTLALLAGLAAFFVWLARINADENDEYDIFFKQSVAGLANGSTVSFQGVQAGVVREIELWKQDPEFVRVRIGVRDDVPILQGTTATIQGSFTGVSAIQLEGAVKGAPLITEPGPEGVPVIPTKPGGLGELLSNAPLLLERLATLTESLTQVLSDDNRSSVRGILANTNRMTDTLADTSPQLRATLKELEATVAQAGQSLAAFETTMGSTNTLINQEGRVLTKELSETLSSAKQASAELSKTLAAAGPAAQQLNDTTLPATEATLRDLRRTSEALREATETLNQKGAGALIGGQTLPDYEP